MPPEKRENLKSPPSIRENRDFILGLITRRSCFQYMSGKNILEMPPEKRENPKMPPSARENTKMPRLIRESGKLPPDTRENEKKPPFTREIATIRLSLFGTERCNETEQTVSGKKNCKICHVLNEKTPNCHP